MHKSKLKTADSKENAQIIWELAISGFKNQLSMAGFLAQTGVGQRGWKDELKTSAQALLKFQKEHNLSDINGFNIRIYLK